MPAADIPIVAFDYGMKYNILRRLRQHGFATQVLPATATAQEALKHKPAGIFLSNGPGDPAALDYIVREVKTLLDTGIPIFGICLGHQILGQAFGGKTFKLKFGHRGGNQPVKDLESGRVEITSQNHGFAVDAKSLPSDVAVHRVNLNDGTVEGMRHKTKPVYCVPIPSRGLARAARFHAAVRGVPQIDRAKRLIERLAAAAHSPVS